MTSYSEYKSSTRLWLPNFPERINSHKDYTFIEYSEKILKMNCNKNGVDKWKRKTY